MPRVSIDPDRLQDLAGPARPKSNAGRPNTYRGEYAPQAYKLCLLGATIQELADFFEINNSTVYQWMKYFPEFANAIRDGREVADAEVAHSLYKRATGMRIPAVKIISVAGPPGAGSTVEYHEYEEVLPPDVGAATKWLASRSRRWREKQEVELVGKNGGPITSATVTIDTNDPQEASKLYQQLMQGSTPQTK